MLTEVWWGLINGITAWPTLLLHIFNVIPDYPVYNININTGWYQFGFLVGSGSPLLGFLGRKK